MGLLALRQIQTLIDLAGDDFWEVSPAISIGCLMPESDEIRPCAPIVLAV
jgi:hypothetical protein